MFKKLAAFLPVILIIACKDYKPEMEQALMQRDSVIFMSEAKDSSISAFLETLTEIENNLDSITLNQEAISMDTRDKVEFSKDIRERINENISVINSLLEKNKSMITSLNEQLRKSKYNIGSLKKMVEQLNSDVAAKDSELVSLNLQLADLKLMMDSMSQSIDSLNVQNQNKASLITSQTTQLNTAYWAIGTYKELKAVNILSKEGGFLGLGKEQVLKKNFNNDAFTPIDITQILSFDIGKKTAKVITNHPTDTYTLDKDTEGLYTKLIITDPARFWKASKYLVIVTG
jgi:hypothetical protein